MKRFSLAIVLFLVLVLGQQDAFAATQSEAIKIIQSKCSDCHSAQTKFPFYADFPIARDIISQDVNHARTHFHFDNDLVEPYSEVFLAKLERVIKNGSMPPFRYTALHWDKFLSKADKEILLQWLRNYRETNYGSSEGDIIAALPSHKEVLAALDIDKVKLGKKLYHDVRLSGNNTVSCASCHGLDKGGSDQAQYATGIHGAMGHINSPTTFNSSYNFKQFWDGRADSLEAQAHGPVHNPAEMGSNWSEVIGKIGKDEEYLAEFVKVYGEGKDIINGDNIVDAIAEFERALVTSGSPFDKYLDGDNNAIGVEAKQGYDLFKNIGCASCHVGASLGGKSFEKLPLAYFTDREHEKGMRISKEDYGRYNVTNRESDKYKFKVPNLRNISETHPYFHDGSVGSLDEAVRLMARYELGRTLNDTEVKLIVKFLESLTGAVADI